MVFNTSNWHIWQTVDVSVSSITEQASYEVTHTVSGGGNYNGVTAPKVSVVVQSPKDEYIVGPSSGSTWDWLLGVAQGGTNAYTIRLSSAPKPDTASVTITPSQLEHRRRDRVRTADFHRRQLPRPADGDRHRRGRPSW